MPDNATGLNAQYQSPPFGLGGDYTSTGAAGSPSNPDASFGPVIGSPAVVVNYQSSQAPITHVDVTTGDTSGMSSDAPIPPSGDPLTGLGLDFIAETGAGRGTYGHFRHPSSMNGGA